MPPIKQNMLHAAQSFCTVDSKADLLPMVKRNLAMLLAEKILHCRDETTKRTTTPDEEHRKQE